MRKRLPRSRFNQDVIVTDAERKKLKDTYCSGINEIKNVFDYVIDYQKKSNNLRFYDEYNYIRIVSIIFRLYDIPIKDIIELEKSNINLKEYTIAFQKYNISIDGMMFDYIKHAVNVSDMMHSKYIICDSGGNKIENEKGFMSLMNNFKTYMKTILSKNNNFSLKLISANSLRDSMRFESVLKKDSEIGFTHNLKLLKPIFMSEFITRDCSQSNINMKIRLKYDLYLKWFKVFYEERGWEEGEYRKFI